MGLSVWTSGLTGEGQGQGRGAHNPQGYWRCLAFHFSSTMPLNPGRWDAQRYSLDERLGLVILTTESTLRSHGHRNPDRHIVDFMNGLQQRISKLELFAKKYLCLCNPKILESEWMVFLFCSTILHNVSWVYRWPRLQGTKNFWQILHFYLNWWTTRLMAFQVT